MQQLIKQVEQWADDRNLIDGSNPKKQMLKLMEEFGELCGGIAKNKPEVIKDSIGDCFVVLTILNKQVRSGYCIADNYNKEIIAHWGIDDLLLGIVHTLGEIAVSIKYSKSCIALFRAMVGFLHQIADKQGLIFQDCVQHAYDQIKDRKGKMIDGVFVKEEDL